MHRNASLPWLILVPDTEETALYRLPDARRDLVVAEWNRVAAWVHDHFRCTRVNVAAIGNLVPQLHLHVVGRHEGDPCWPGVVWGQALPDATWRPEDIASMRSAWSPSEGR